ncbi:MAG: hypothetical protein ABEL51_06030 [Salinibacter sp.]
MATSDDNASARSWRRWIAGGVFLIFFAFLMWEVVNPYRGQRFEKIPHGDHVHYVPKNRNPDVSVSRFPTRKPDDDERITPKGKVVPLRNSGRSP